MAPGRFPGEVSLPGGDSRAALDTLEQFYLSAELGTLRS